MWGRLAACAPVGNRRCWVIHCGRGLGSGCDHHEERNLSKATLWGFGNDRCCEFIVNQLYGNGSRRCGAGWQPARRLATGAVGLFTAAEVLDPAAIIMKSAISPRQRSGVLAMTGAVNSS